MFSFNKITVLIFIITSFAFSALYADELDDVKRKLKIVKLQDKCIKKAMRAGRAAKEVYSTKNKECERKYPEFPLESKIKRRDCKEDSSRWFRDKNEDIQELQEECEEAAENI